MSDGPYKSLPMSCKWKKAAKLAENSASDPFNISNAAALAI
jgi:hypothetical protein